MKSERQCYVGVLFFLKKSVYLIAKKSESNYLCLLYKFLNYYDYEEDNAY